MSAVGERWDIYMCRADGRIWLPRRGANARVLCPGCGDVLTHVREAMPGGVVNPLGLPLPLMRALGTWEGSVEVLRARVMAGEPALDQVDRVAKGLAVLASELVLAWPRGAA